MKRTHPERFDDQPKINKSVARVLKDYRVKNGLSQRQAGLEFKTSQSNIAQYETEVRDSPVSFQIRLAVASGTPLEEINFEIARLILKVKPITKTTPAQKAKDSQSKAEIAEIKKAKEESRFIRKPSKKQIEEQTINAIDAVDEKLAEITTKVSRPKTPAKKKTQTPLAKAKAAR